MAETLTWNHFMLLVGLIAGWSLVIIATVRWVLSAGLRNFSQKLLDQDEKIKKISDKNHEIELAVCSLRADLPLCYVRREDFIREEVTINTKLDRLRDMISRQSGEPDDSGS